LNIFLGVCTVVGTVYTIIGYHSPSNPSLNLKQQSSNVKDISEIIPGVSVVGVRFEREPSDSDEAELDIKRLSEEWSTTGQKVHVKGLALYGTNEKYHPRGPNIGDIDFVSHVTNNRIKYKEDFGDGRTYQIEIIFTSDGLEVKEDTPPGRFGMGVTFAGRYHPAADIKEVVNSAK